MRMGRIRQSRKDLPKRVYLHHGAYYITSKENKRIPLGRDYAEAMKRWAEVVGEDNRPAGTIGAIMDRYLREVIPAKRERTQADYTDAIKRLRPVFGSMRPDDIEPKHIYQYMDLRGSPVRANREIAVLSGVMELAVRIGAISANPCRQVRRATERARTRNVLDAEIHSFGQHCPDWLKAYITLKLLIGLRQADMLALSKANITDDGLLVATGKTGKRILFKWSPALRDAVAAIRSIRPNVQDTKGSFWINRDGQPMTASGFKSAWARAMADYLNDGVERFREHDLRAKAADYAESAGRDASKLLGHADGRTTKRHYLRGTSKVEPL